MLNNAYFARGLMTFVPSEEALEFIRLSRQIGRERATMPAEQRVLLDSPKFNGPIGLLNDGDDAATPIEAAQVPEDSMLVVQDQINKP